MKIQSLFEAYKEQVNNFPNVEDIFRESGMVNEYARLDMGFFPLGSGIMTENSEINNASINVCKIMVLGNDFGTVDYVNQNCPNKREKSTNPTIKNLLGLGLNTETTFFTNLYLGLRKEGKNTSPKVVTKDYRDFCFNFFRTQLDQLNPKIVLCLGKQVIDSLVQFSGDFSKHSKMPVAKLFSATGDVDFIVESEGRKYVLIPHPSYAHINWTKEIRHKIKNAIEI